MGYFLPDVADDSGCRPLYSEPPLTFAGSCAREIAAVLRRPAIRRPLLARPYVRRPPGSPRHPESTHTVELPLLKRNRPGPTPKSRNTRLATYHYQFSARPPAWPSAPGPPSRGQRPRPPTISRPWRWAPPEGHGPIRLPRLTDSSAELSRHEDDEVELLAALPAVLKDARPRS